MEHSKLDKVQQEIIETKPDDTGSLSVEGHIKIFNPETGEILVEKRA